MSTTKTAKASVKRSKIKKKLSAVRLYVKARYNNCLVTATDMEGKVLAWSSAGKVGFKGSRKATPFASQKATEDLIEMVKDTGATSAHLFISGGGMGRDSFLRTIQASDLHIESIKDTNGFPHGGVRKKKERKP